MRSCALAAAFLALVPLACGAPPPASLEPPVAPTAASAPPPVSASTPQSASAAPRVSAAPAPKAAPTYDCVTVDDAENLVAIGDRPVAFGARGMKRLDEPKAVEEPFGNGWPKAIEERQAVIRTDLISGSSLEQLSMIVSPIPVGQAPQQHWALANRRWTRAPMPPGAKEIIALYAFGDGLIASDEQDKLFVLRGKVELPRSRNPRCGPRGVILRGAVGRDGSLAITHDDCSETATSVSVRRFDAKQKALAAFVPPESSPFADRWNIAIASDRALVLLTKAKVAWLLVESTPTVLTIAGVDQNSDLRGRPKGGVLVTTSDGVVRLDANGAAEAPTVPWEAFFEQADAIAGNRSTPVEGVDGALYFMRHEKNAPARVVRCTTASAPGKR